MPWPSVSLLASLGKADLLLTPEDNARVTALQPGLDPSEWSIDQVAQIAFMAASYAADDAAFATAFDGSARRPRTAGVSCRRTTGAKSIEAVRSGMKPAFEPVAHRNPYPVERFTEKA